MQLEVFKSQEEQKHFIKSTVEKIPFDVLNEDIEDKNAIQ